MSEPMLTLGTGDTTIEVMDGDEVPLHGGKSATVRLHCEVWVATFVVQLNGRIVHRMTDFDHRTGEFYYWPPGNKVGIDLDALRRERAPKVETAEGWTVGIPAGLSSYMLSTQHNYSDCRYWTHRPGNTPEKQAAFDAALDGWLTANLGDDNVTTPNALRAAARALGYGSTK